MRSNLSSITLQEMPLQDDDIAERDVMNHLFPFLTAVSNGSDNFLVSITC